MAQLLFDVQTIDTSDKRGGGTKMQPGIHEGVSFGGVTKDGVGEEAWYDINFSAEDGRSIHKRIFAPNAANPKEGEAPQDTLFRKGTANVKNLAFLYKMFNNTEQIPATFKGGYQEVMGMLTNALNIHKGRKVNLKVTPDQDAKYPELGYFIGSAAEMHLPGVPSKLAFGGQEIARMKEYKDNLEKYLADKTDNKGSSVVV